MFIYKSDKVCALTASGVPNSRPEQIRQKRLTWTFLPDSSAMSELNGRLRFSK
jgi:hypothetical protein